MKKIAIVLFFPLLLLLSTSVFIINETEQAIITQFGKPVGNPITISGLHFKTPLIQKVSRFDRRILQWDGAANDMPTKDNKYIFIDAFARWTISDPLKFYKAAKTEMIAQSLLDDIIDGAVRDEISNRNMSEIIRFSDRVMNYGEESEDSFFDEVKDNRNDVPGARLEIIASVFNNVDDKLSELDMGISIIDLQLKRINYSPQDREQVFYRMISGQNKLSEKYRARGQGKKQEILGTQIQKKKEILSDAYVKSQTIRGNADAKATEIYAKAYGKSTEFYNFLKILETYERTIDSTSTVILSTNNKYLKYLNKTK